MFRLMKQSKTIRRLLDLASMNAGVMRMISVTLGLFFFCHLMACFWFLSAKFADFHPDTWVT